MAIHPELDADRAQALPPATSIERVEAWTVSQTADVLAATSISSPSHRLSRGTSVVIDIPLDEQALLEEQQPRPRTEPVHTVYKRREPIRRDSIKRREALLKGKEGSRRRQRWENDRLLSNPHAEPPLPSDWQVQPTHTVQNVPYFLAPLWDAQYAKKSAERQRRVAAAKAPASKEEAVAAQVTSELRAKLKKSRGAKTLLQDLEEEIRGFVSQWDEKQRELENEGLIEPDSSDDEIVFVGRNSAMSDDKRKEKDARHLQKDKLIFQGLVDDHGAAFGRYLVHSIASYYGLKTWSVTTGSPARREAYVGLKVDPTTRRPSLTRSELPRPLWTVRWPNSVEAHKKDLNFLVDTIHDDWETYAKQKQENPGLQVPTELLEMLRLLADTIEQLDEERLTWWTSPEKRALRKRLEDGGEQRKLSDLHNINNNTVSSIESLNAKFGMFVKWGLGMKGGVWELKNAHKVASG
ncbi:hypothetical protein CBER1_02158 [Cercospora berteroae]|uniref:R3H-associated N-terminal domain-containing protein n=1 Tax=Cercospora berteroae TaxID=357750 RepID=A0A2S6BQB7_9PEZI|nr:hypothetical protein CBER1_02158 [Cercospora berteroae]